MRELELVYGTKLCEDFSIYYLTEHALEVDLVCVKIKDKFYTISYNTDDKVSTVLQFGLTSVVSSLFDLNIHDRFGSMLELFMQLEDNKDLIEAISKISDDDLLVLV